MSTERLTIKEATEVATAIFRAVYRQGGEIKKDHLHLPYHVTEMLPTVGTKKAIWKFLISTCLRAVEMNNAEYFGRYINGSGFYNRKNLIKREIERLTEKDPEPGPPSDLLTLVGVLHHFTYQLNYEEAIYQSSKHKIFPDEEQKTQWKKSVDFLNEFHLLACRRYVETREGYSYGKYENL